MGDEEDIEEVYREEQNYESSWMNQKLVEVIFNGESINIKVGKSLEEMKAQIQTHFSIDSPNFKLRLKN